MEEHKHMKRKLFSFGIAGGLAVLAIASAARAESIPIVNPSFEIPPVKEGIRTFGGIPGWTFLSDGTSIAEAGVTHPPLLGFPPVTPTDGLQVGYMHVISSPNAFGEAFISQVTGATVTAGVVYILSVDFLRSVQSAGLPGHCISGLRTPTLPLAVSGAPFPPETLTATFEALPGNPSIGEPLQISIHCANEPTAVDRFFFFDNVRLDAIRPINPPVKHGAFGLIDLLPFETARLNAFCESPVTTAPSMTTTPCEATLEFHDINGRLLQHSELTLRSGAGGVPDQTPPPVGGWTSGQIVPSWRVC